jgi:ribose/xylose/arabinose/galactoside ABC-type transport system permease subunit
MGLAKLSFTIVKQTNTHRFRNAAIIAAMVLSWLCLPYPVGLLLFLAGGALCGLPTGLLRRRRLLHRP